MSLIQPFAVCLPNEPTYLPPCVVFISQKSKFSLLQIALYLVEIVDLLSVEIFKSSQKVLKLVDTLTYF